MRRHISVHRATTKYFSNSFVFKNEIEKEGLPRDITPTLGAVGQDAQGFLESSSIYHPPETTQQTMQKSQSNLGPVQGRDK
jgi:hypothetical protein